MGLLRVTVTFSIMTAMGTAMGTTAAELGGIVQRVSQEDALLVLGLAVAFPAARWILDHALFARFATAMLLGPGHKRGARVADKLVARMRKLRECLWKLACYLLFVVMACASMLHQPWFWDTRQYWAGWPKQDGTAMLQLMCVVELAYYVSGAVMLAYWEVPRKDQRVMMLHHAAAIVLVAACYLCNYTRAGCVIMLLHDVNDVIMEAAKLCSYLGRETLANALFVLFVVSWVALRMLAFPFVIIRSTMFEVVEVLGHRPPFYLLINALFVLLCCIHVYWFFLIVKVVWQMATTGKAEDVREEEE